jgi:hypothetical protein
VEVVEYDKQFSYYAPMLSSWLFSRVHFPNLMILAFPYNKMGQSLACMKGSGLFYSYEFKPQVISKDVQNKGLQIRNKWF